MVVLSFQMPACLLPMCTYVYVNMFEVTLHYISGSLRLPRRCSAMFILVLCEVMLKLLKVCLTVPERKLFPPLKRNLWQQTFMKCAIRC